MDPLPTMLIRLVHAWTTLQIRQDCSSSCILIMAALQQDAGRQPAFYAFLAVLTVRALAHG